ncbi:MAG: hemerythrin domain-containing protein [Bacteroidia bacterium]
MIRFSQEHHYGLLFVWKIRQGIKNNIDAARMAAFTLFFFENDLQDHFKAEESVLFTKLDKENPLIDRALKEHRAIYNLINDIRSNGNSVDLLAEFANTLEKHIRFEEREMFNYLQGKLSETELTMVIENQEKPEDVSQKWGDRFWESLHT